MNLEIIRKRSPENYLVSLSKRRRPHSRAISPRVVVRLQSRLEAATKPGRGRSQEIKV
jgi:hypothetical protein